MKKLTLLAASIIFLHTANAQIEKGSLFIGGSMGFSSSTTDQSTSPDNVKGSAWNLSPQIGTAIQKNLIAGVGIVVSESKSENSLNSKSTNNTYALNFFLRKYYPIANKWLLFGEGSVRGNIYTGNSKANNTQVGDTKGWGIGLNIAPGITYNIFKKFWLETSLPNLGSIGYSSSKTNHFNSGEIDNTQKTTSFNAGVSISGLQNFAIGVRWIL